MQPGRSAQRLRILVLGYVVRGPLGGLAWHYLQYALGLMALGHDVYYLELSPEGGDCFDPRRGTTGADPAYGLAFATSAFDRVGLGERWAYRDARSAWIGPASPRIAELSRTADVLLNVSAVNPIDALAGVPIRAFIDTDPAFTQVHHLTEPDQHRRAASHNVFFTFGENIAAGTSAVPPDGFPWQATRQPVVLDAWPVTPGPVDGAFTTVMFWNSYKAVCYQGREYGTKAASFAPYLSLPRRVTGPLEIAVSRTTAPADLAAHGWTLVEPTAATDDPWAFQRYVRGSRGEFSVAKQGYVTPRTGWFSERSTGYLASGRPVVVQDTGFTSWLHADAGVVPFTSPETAAAAIDRVRTDYPRHCRAARDVAAAYFDARVVLTSLIDRAMAKPGSAPAPSRTGR